MTPQTARFLISHQLLDMRNVEVTLAGHFQCLDEVEDLLLKYLGTIPSRCTFPTLSSPIALNINPFSAKLGLPTGSPIDSSSDNFALCIARNFPNRIDFSNEAKMVWRHLSEDEEQRAVAYMCFPVMNRWGFSKFTLEPSMEVEESHFSKQHCLFKSRTAYILVEV